MAADSLDSFRRFRGLDDEQEDDLIRAGTRFFLGSRSIAIIVGLAGKPKLDLQLMYLLY